jgi:hypothetical protein
MRTNFFSPLSFVAVFGSGIRDPGWVKIRIRHLGSATLIYTHTYQLLLYILNRNKFFKITFLINFMSACWILVRFEIIADPQHVYGTYTLYTRTQLCQ